MATRRAALSSFKSVLHQNYSQTHNIRSETLSLGHVVYKYIVRIKVVTIHFVVYFLYQGDYDVITFLLHFTIFFISVKKVCVLLVWCVYVLPGVVNLLTSWFPWFQAIGPGPVGVVNKTILSVILL